MDVFHQHLAGALGHAAMDLAVQQQRIEHGADVVDHAVAHDLDHTGARSISTSQTWQPFGKFCTPAL